MAKNKKKKPRHTQLVLPGEKSGKTRKEEERPEHGTPPAGATDRLGRPLAETPPVVEVIPTAKVVLEKGTPAAKPQGVAVEGQAPEGAQEPPPPKRESDGADAAGAEEDGLSLVPAPQRAPVRGNTTTFPAVGKNDGPAGAGKEGKPAPAQKKKAKAGAAKKKAAGPKPGSAADEEEGNALRLSAARARKSKRVQAVKRKKLWRRVQVGIALALVAATIWVFASGFYITASVTFSEVFESMRLSMQPGDGFPMELSVPNVLTAESMGSSGFAVLGETDLVVVSSTGRQLRSTPHALSSPAMTAGKTRVCVYGRNSTSFRIEGRSQQIFSGNMDQEILFAEMSPGGWLGMCTASNYQAVFRIYGPATTDIQKHSFRWTLIDEKPFMAEFHNDDKHFALACLTTVNGALTTNIHLMHTGRAEKLASIQAIDAVALQMHYLSANRLLVLYHRYAAIYDGNGSEVARYDYVNRPLYTADTTGGRTALVFGSKAQNTATLVQLDRELNVTGTVPVHITDTPMVLAQEQGALLMADGEVLAFSADGRAQGVYTPQAKPVRLVRAGAPLLLTMETVEDLSDLLAHIEPASASVLPGASDAGGYQPAGQPEETVSVLQEGAATQGQGSEPPETDAAGAEAGEEPETDVPP